MTTKQALQLLTTLRPKTVYSLSHLDTCTTDYFSGHHLPIVQVMVDESSTFQEIKSNLLEYIATCHLEDLDTEAYEIAVDELFKEIKFPATTVPKSLWNIGSMYNEEDWDLYMYFVIETVGEDDE